MKTKIFLISAPIVLILIGVIMDKTRDNIWFQQSTKIACDIENVNRSIENLGEHYINLISVYPGMTTTELIEHGDDYVSIKTSEGLMKRTNFSVLKSENRIVIEFDEEYITSKLTTTSHFVENFEAKADSVELDITISNITAPGFLGFFLRNFGGKSIGNAFLNSYKTILEK